MVNQNIQSPIVIPGPGHVTRRNGDLRAGEYKKLVNCEIKDGRIVNRRNIRTKQVTAETDTERTLGRPIGFWNDWTIYSVLDSISYPALNFSAVNDDLSQTVEGYDPSTGIGIIPGVDVGEFVSGVFEKHNEVGAFQYNNKFHILYWGLEENTLSVSYGLVSFDDSVVRDSPDFSLSDIHTVYDRIISSTFYDVNYSRQSFKNFFLYKERLWVVTEGALYFSASTFPEDFTVLSGGGYFNFNDDKINYAFSCNDVIYIICDSGTYSLTYNVDPNEDSVVNKISNSVGGLYGCEFRGSPYLINNDGIFLIYNNYVDRVFSTDLDLGLNNYTYQTLNSYIDYLVINKAYIVNIDNLDPPSETEYAYRINLCPNPDAGDGIGLPHTGSGVPNAWYKASTGDSAASVSIVSSDAHTGTYSLKWMSSGVIVGSLSNGVSLDAAHEALGTSFKIKVQQGKRYVVSFYAKTAVANVISHITVSKFNSAAVIQAAGITVAAGNNATAIGAAYQRYYAYFDIPADVSYISLATTFKKSSGNWALNDTVYLDSFLIEEVPTSQTTPDAFFMGDDAPVGVYTHAWIQTDRYTYQETYLSVEYYSFYHYYLTLFPQFNRDDEDVDGNNNDYNLFFLNMLDQTLHAVKYHPIYVTGSTYCEFPIGISSNYNVSNANLLMLFDYSDYVEIGGSGTPSALAYMEYELSTSLYDTVLQKTNLTSTHVYTTKKREPQILIEKNSICPDGNEYLMKKYRNLEIMAKFPKDKFELSVAYDNTAYGTAGQINDDEALLVSGEYRGHQPHRIGLNQRARELSLKFNTTAVLDAAPNDTIWDFLEISDLRLLWSYTNRAPINKSFTP